MVYFHKHAMFRKDMRPRLLSRLSYIIAATSGNVHSDICAQRRFRSACAFAQSDKHLDSQGCRVSTCGQKRLLSDCADAQADLSLRWVYISDVTFYHDVAHRKTYFDFFLECLYCQTFKLCYLIHCILDKVFS